MSRYASREAEDAEQAVRDTQARLEGNNYCADCGHPRPQYMNLTIGTFICQLCCDIHRTMSNRRIKDIFGGELTMEDARRMDMVGNDKANRKFLATWNAREVPEPDRRDKESLREFLWLKYDGSFKKQPQLQPQPPAPPTGDYRPGDRYYNERLPTERSRDYDRDRGGYMRERELFREPAQNPETNRSYLSARYDTSRPSQAPSPTEPLLSHQRDDYYRLGSASGPPYPDRYRGGTGPSDRFQPPQPTPIVPYGRAIRNARARYQEQGLPYEDYASLTSEDRDDLRRRVPASRTNRRAVSSQESFGYSDGDGDVDQPYRTAKPVREKGRSRGRKNTIDGANNNYYGEEDDADVEDVETSRPKKSQPRKSKKSTKDSKSRRRNEEDEEYDEDDEEYEDERESQIESVGRKSKKSASKKSDKRSDRDRDSVVTTSVEGLDVSTGPGTRQPARTEFDLMSEWMGDSKETDGSHGTPSAQNAGSPNRGAIPAAMQQAYATTHLPMMAPPMSVYGGMMPVPGGGYVPVMGPGFVPGMGIPGMPPGMSPGMPPGMPPGMHPGMFQGMPPGMPPGIPPGMSPGMLGIPGGPGMAGQQIPPMQGVMNGMQHLNLNHGDAANANAAPPPPPPMGMPAGPPPGPPAEPP